MNSREMFLQFNTGAVNSDTALKYLSQICSDTSSPEKLSESARARYVIGFIHRVEQYRSGVASERDLCLNIRDIAIVFGRIQLAKTLYLIVQRTGQEFGLVCESDNQVSCSLQVPEWLQPSSYVKDVYSLKPDEDALESSSAGDALLREYTYYHDYKSFEQKLAVHTAMHLPKGDTLLISQPTGGGKSLVTQMMAASTDGLTIVIVPTVALALDQYYSACHVLKENAGIFCYRGAMSDADRLSIFKALEDKVARLLFTSPEAILKSNRLYSLLSDAATSGYLLNIVIDEAHVVPDWGVFFRPDFQLFSIVHNQWRRDPGSSFRTVMLSATLTDTVVSTLFTLFGEEGHNVQFRCDALRQEPRFYFHSVRSLRERTEKLIEAVVLLPKPLVLYVLEPKEAKQLQKVFKARGYKNIPIFTGATNDAERDRVLTGWKEQKFDVVIATSAFGIGVDKPDVRTVIHACCPENLSRFYQEVGRGGRDRLSSLSLFMPYQGKIDGKSDVERASGLVTKRVLTVERSVVRWRSMMQAPTAIINGSDCILDTTTPPDTFEEDEIEYAGNRNMFWNINLLLFFHRIGFITLQETTYDPEHNAYTVSVHLNDPDVLHDEVLLAEELKKPRAREYQSQTEDYNVIKDLVGHPKRTCWGRVFRHLYPLSRDVCNGCPCDPEGRSTSDEEYKLRNSPKISLSPTVKLAPYDRLFGSYDNLLILRNDNGPCSEEEVALLNSKVNRSPVGAVVLPDRFLFSTDFRGLVLSHDEFLFAMKWTPYLFAEGILCVLDDKSRKNLSIIKAAESRKQYHYWAMFYLSEDEFTRVDRRLKAYFNGYTVPLDRL